MSPYKLKKSEVIVVGGGPAGLQCSLVLARANRSVIFFDYGDKRSEASLLQHAVLGGDGENIFASFLCTNKKKYRFEANAKLR